MDAESLHAEVMSRSPELQPRSDIARKYITLSETRNPHRPWLQPKCIAFRADMVILKPFIAWAKELQASDMHDWILDPYGFGRSLYCLGFTAPEGGLAQGGGEDDEEIGATLGLALEGPIGNEIGCRLHWVRTGISVCITGSDVFPHYDQHPQRAGEYTASLLLRDDGDVTWPIFAEGYPEFRQRVGDLVVMTARELLHWRPPYEGQIAVRAIIRYSMYSRNFNINGATIRERNCD